MLTAKSLPSFAESLFHPEALASTPASVTPYPHIIASNLLASSAAADLERDFPAINRSGFFPVKNAWRKGAFARLLSELEGNALPAILSDKLGIDLNGKPRMITIRKWSAGQDGRIHNDSVSKIATALLYLKQTDAGNSGRFRILKNDSNFDAMTAEVSADYGNFVAFKRTENSWHGHKPFAGERRVVQITWLQSWDDYYRKEKRGKFSWLLKAFKRGY